MMLRPYQQEAHDKAIEHIKNKGVSDESLKLFTVYKGQYTERSHI